MPAVTPKKALTTHKSAQTPKKPLKNFDTKVVDASKSDPVMSLKRIDVNDKSWDVKEPSPTKLTEKEKSPQKTCISDVKKRMILTAFQHKERSNEGGTTGLTLPFIGIRIGLSRRFVGKPLHSIQKPKRLEKSEDFS